ncbi:MAG: 50S ribosomal protein L1 [Verrucomicrobia bacterium]|nr:50S ribosomal protein L1 [Verrucomicrobiota bacterium]
MAVHGKKHRAISEKAPTGVQELESALAFITANPAAKFDETVDLGIRLGIDPKKSENAIRGSVSLPHGSGKNVRVIVFAAGAAADAARAAGATEVGNEDLIEKVKGGWVDFDVAVATPDAMQEVRKLGRVLGPRGLMPNPKTGTVTNDTAEAVRLCKAGKVEFRMDRQGCINVPVGKLSFEPAQLAENARAVVSAVQHEKPAGAKGIFIKHCTVSSTMGVGLRVNLGLG